MKHEGDENTLIISEESCKKYGFTIEEFLMFTLIKTGVDLKDLYKNMLQKEMIIEKQTLISKSVYVTERWNDLWNNIALDKDASVPERDRLINLATKLMEIFPSGRKEGTNHYWRGNKKDVTNKLEKFFKRYGNKYTDEQLIKATQKYVDSHHSNYSYMRVLKYFIWKDERKLRENGEVYIEEVSDLASFIENFDSEEKSREDWMSTLI